MYLLTNTENQSVFISNLTDLNRLFFAFTSLMKGVNKISREPFSIIEEQFSNDDFILIECNSKPESAQNYESLNTSLHNDIGELDIAVYGDQYYTFIEADEFSVQNYGVFFKVLCFLDSEVFLTQNENFESYSFSYEGDAIFNEYTPQENQDRQTLIKYMQSEDRNGEYKDSLSENPISLDYCIETLKRWVSEEGAELSSYILSILKRYEKA